MSQLSCFGAPDPRTWDEIEERLIVTFAGGYHDDGCLPAFQHGMRTVVAMLKAEFPPAEMCRAASSLYLVAQKTLTYIEALGDPSVDILEDPNDPSTGTGMIAAKLRAAIAKAEATE